MIVNLICGALFVNNGLGLTPICNTNIKAGDIVYIGNIQRFYKIKPEDLKRKIDYIGGHMQFETDSFAAAARLNDWLGPDGQTEWNSSDCDYINDIEFIDDISI